MAPHPSIPLAILLLGAFVAACSSATGGSRSSANCVLEAADSIYAVSAPLYRECAVDRPARAIQSNLEMGRSNMPPTNPCMRAEAQFVVGADGVPEPGTIRLLQSNNAAITEALRRSIPGWRYRPALLNQQPVRQLVRVEQKAAVTVVSAGSSGRRPSCG